MNPSLAALPLAFGATIFLSAILLFSVQPLVGKLLLPLLGGAPSVWNTVMVFFQAMLLAGYAYAHFSFQRLGHFQYLQPLVHVALLLLASFTVPFLIGADHNSALQHSNPALWVLLVLTKTIGLPIFVLASTAPLLQKWFATTAHPSAKDPYFLYAASNLGSFGSLFAYPLLLEPYLRLQHQIRYWSIGFWLLALFIAGCALLTRRRAPAELVPEQSAAEPIPPRRILKWVALSFIPSSLMLGVTNYITTDVASVPLLWVVPLALYLFTFVIAFSKHSSRAEVGSSRAVPILALAVVFTMLAQATEPVVVLVLIHLLFFLFAALQCHLKLAHSRPPAAQLTAFYLWLSVGGVLGGVFNALLAPVLFHSILEYPLMIVIATIIGFPERGSPKSRFSLPPIYGGALIILVFAIASALIVMLSQNILWANILTGTVLIACYLLVRRPIRYAIALSTLLLTTALFRQTQSRVIERDRNFFGVLRVVDDAEKPLRRLYHGTTVHGIQSRTAERKCYPLSYYHPQGPVSEITTLFESSNLPRHVGLVGLGAGAMLAYSQPGQTWTIFEIDPAVIRVAQDPQFFTYLSDCTRATVKMLLGDARLRLHQTPDATFGLLYVDAFSSDVIPMHLLSLEAVRLYRQKLAPDGLLAFHLSSRHFELNPLVANLGRALNLVCFTSTVGDLNAPALVEGGFESTWTILVPESQIPAVTGRATWFRIEPQPNGPLWTDDFSSLLGVLRL